jgi:hypothetical protein
MALPIIHRTPAKTNINTMTSRFGLPNQICHAPPATLAKPNAITSPKTEAIISKSSGPPVNLDDCPGSPLLEIIPAMKIPSPPMKITREAPRKTNTQPRKRTFLGDCSRRPHFGHLPTASVVSKSHLGQLSTLLKFGYLVSKVECFANHDRAGSRAGWPDPGNPTEVG